MSEVWVGTSWKMNKTLAAAAHWIDTVAAAGTPAGVQLFVIPPATALAHVRHRLPATSSILLGAQNAHWEPDGAVTGELSMALVRDAGADLVEIGHSERRARFGETDGVVADKVVAAVHAGLVPLVCVGEPADVRAAGVAEDYVVAQVRAAVSGLRPEQAGDVLIAYEPVWSIGVHGHAAQPGEVAPVLAAVRDGVRDLAGRPPRALLYGGSVTPDNARALLDVPGTDGLFAGRAGLDPAGFLELLDRCTTAIRLEGESSDTPTSTEQGAPGRRRTAAPASDRHGVQHQVPDPGTGRRDHPEALRPGRHRGHALHQGG